MSFPWFKGLRLTAGCRPSNLGTMLALCWAYVGLCWAYVGPCWAILGAMLGPCLGHLCWNDLKMPIFPPRAPSWSPKPRKNRGFVTSPRWNPLPPKGPKHRKKRCFSTSRAQNTVNYRNFSWHGVRPAWTGVGRRHGRRASITFGYHRRKASVARAPIIPLNTCGFMKRAAAPCHGPLEWSALACGCYCLTLPSEPCRKTAVEARKQLPRSWLRHSETPPSWRSWPRRLPQAAFCTLYRRTSTSPGTRSLRSWPADFWLYHII